MKQRRFLKIHKGFLLMALIGIMTLQGCSGTKRRSAADLTPILNPINIERVWSVNLGKALSYSFKSILNGDDVYASSEGGEILTEPLVVAGLVVVRTIDNRFIAIDAQTGKRRWVTPKTPSLLSLRTSYSMAAINNEVIFTGFSSGQFGLINLANGSTIWESLLAPPKGTSEIERLSDIAAKPTLMGTRMCAVSYQGKVGCGDIKTAKMSWSKDFSSFSGTTQSPDAVFVVNDKSYVVAFDAIRGDELWRNEKLVWRDVGEPLAVGKYILAGDSQGYLHLFSQDKGDELGRVRVDSSGITAGPIATQSSVIVQTKGGTLAAYRIQ